MDERKLHIACLIIQIYLLMVYSLSQGTMRTKMNKQNRSHLTIGPQKTCSTISISN